MNTNGWSSVTVKNADAYEVIARAFPMYLITLDPVGLPHYHATDKNGTHIKAGENQYVVHSFYCAKTIVY